MRGPSIIRMDVGYVMPPDTGGASSSTGPATPAFAHLWAAFSAVDTNYDDTEELEIEIQQDAGKLRNCGELPPANSHQGIWDTSQ